MTKQEFIDWKNHSVTKEVLRAFERNVVQIREYLETSAGTEPLQDRYFCGYLAAVKDFSNADFVEVSE